MSGVLPMVARILSFGCGLGHKVLLWLNNKIHFSLKIPADIFCQRLFTQISHIDLS
jgi:hypothetical protein